MEEEPASDSSMVLSVKFVRLEQRWNACFCLRHTPLVKR
jgi:hypothetical protein